MDPVLIDGANTGFVMVSAFLVLLMTPGLAFFYGGMSRSKSVLNMMMMSFGALGVIGIVYVLWGWSMSYGESDVALLFNSPFETFGLDGVEGASLLGVGFQLTFAACCQEIQHRILLCAIAEVVADHRFKHMVNQILN